MTRSPENASLRQDDGRRRATPSSDVEPFSFGLQAVRVDAGPDEEATATPHADPTESAPKDSAPTWGWFDRMAADVCLARDLHDAGRILAIELRRFYGCRRVAVAWRGIDGKSFSLLALSDVALNSRRSPIKRMYEEAIEEIVRSSDMSSPNEARRDDKSELIWDADSDDGSAFHRARRRLSFEGGCRHSHAIPLRHQGRLIGCILLLDDRQLAAEHVQEVRRRGELQLVPAMIAVERASSSLIQRIREKVRRRDTRWRLVASCLLATVIAVVLAVPRHYRVSCPCELQPSVRRFVPMPFDARLADVQVAPGDVLHRGQVLAELDGRELRCEWASIQADMEKSAKTRDSALARGKTAEAQLARFELQRLDQQRQLVQRKMEQLEIRSPIDGCVISGDLDRVEGASLSKGDTLFEVGPLDRLLVEVHIPEQDIGLVDIGSEVTVRFDAVARQTFHARVLKIHPRAEIVDGENRFVAELQLANDRRQLRPGMKGQAKVLGPKRSIGWALFHRPWRTVRKWFRV